MANHYFIGLGGAGGNILRELRKGMHLRQNEVLACGENLRTEFFYVDSNHNDLNKPWKVMGHPVHLDESRKLLIRDGNLKAVLGDLGKHPAIKPWIGTDTEVLRMIQGDDGTPGAQQRRRFGRFLFAIHIPKFVPTIKRQMDAMISDGARGECTFHLFATLCGGTGSGGLIDAALQIRKLYPDSANYKICVYTLITNDGDNGKDSGDFYPNQYAALKDVNALMLGNLKIHDLSSARGELFDFTKIDRVIHNTILVSNWNDLNIRLSLEQQEKLLAEWVLKTVLAGSAQELDAHFTKALINEDFAPIHPGEPARYRERSFRFSSVGIYRWSVPEQQIREYLSNSAAISVVDQLTWNHWSNGRSFTNSESAASSQTFYNANPLVNFGISIDSISTSGTQGLPVFKIEWANKLRKGVLAQAENAPNPLAVLEEGADRYFKREFRDTGVNAYFQALGNAIDRTAKELVGNIETKLREGWQAGKIGIYDCKQILEMLDADLSTLLDRVNTDSPSYRNESSKADEILSLRRSEWNKVGVISAFFGKKKKMINAHLETLITKYHADTQVASLDFCGRVLTKIRMDVGTLRGICSQLHSNMDMLRASLVSEVSILDDAMQNSDFLGYSEINRNELEEYRKMIIGDKATIEGIAATCRNIGAEDINDFYELATKGYDLICSRLERESEQTTTQKAMDISRDPRSGLAAIIGKNLLERLYQRFGQSAENLSIEMKKFVESAIVSLKLDNAAPQASALAGQELPAMPRRIILIQMPKVPASAAPSEREQFSTFVVNLKKALEGAIPGDYPVYFADSTNPSEMTVIAQTYFMPARFSVATSALKAIYDKKTLGQDDVSKNSAYFCHLSPDWIKNPDLFPEHGTKLRNSAITYYSIAEKLHLIEIGEDKDIYLRVTDESGVPKPDRIADNDAALQRFSDVELNELREKLIVEISKQTSRDLQSVLDAEKSNLALFLEKECSNRVSSPNYIARQSNYDEIAAAIKAITPAN
jgi:hypothetical protein